MERGIEKQGETERKREWGRGKEEKRGRKKGDEEREEEERAIRSENALGEMISQ